MIVFVRHGESEYNKLRLHQGQADNPLTEEGIRQAYEVAEKLKSFKFDQIIASPLIRARKTAEIINEKLNLPLTFDDRLKEHNKGTLSGQSKDIVELKKMYEEDPKQFGAETAEEMYKRCIEVFKDIKKLNKDILIVSHGGVYRMIYRYLNNIDIHEKINTLGNCEIYICERINKLEN